MTGVSGLTTLSAMLLFFDAARASRSLADLRGWRGCNDGGGETPLTLALLGLTGDGKSSTCRWLTAKEEGCVVGHGLESETSRLSMVSKPWVGDERCGDLTTIDTPGIQ